MTDNKFHLKLGYFFLCVLTFIGLIVHAKIHIIEPYFYTIYARDVYIDFFSYYKASFLIIIVGLTTLIMLYGLLKYKGGFSRFKRVEFYLLLAMAFLAVATTVFSKYPEVALNGSIDRYEGLWVWLSYLAIPFLVVYFVRTKEQLNRFIQVLLIPSFIILLIGALQYFGYDIFKQDWIKYIIYTSEQRDMIKELTVTATGVYTTLFNQNYVGSFVALVLPLYIHQLVHGFQTKKIISALFALAGIGVSGIALLGAYSSGGYVAVVFAIMAMVVILVVKKSGLAIKVIAVIFLIGAVGTAGYIYKTNERVRVDLNFGAIFQEQVPEVSLVDQPREILDIITKGHEVKVITTKESITIKDENQNLRFIDDTGTDLVFEQMKDENSFIATDVKYNGYVLNFYLDDDILELVIDGKKIPVLLDSEKLQIAGIRKLPIVPFNAERFGFEGYEKFGSYRGYIWSRTIPLLKNSYVIGSGADTFSFVFPQYDIGRLNKTAWNSLRIIIDKPHNMYLQSAVQFGVVFALVQIMLMAWLMMRLLISRWSDSRMSGIAVLGSLIGFTIIGLVNDSIVSVSPYLWILIGLGLYISKNHHQMKQGEN